MPIPESLKTKYSLSGDRYIAENADRAISDLVACISRMHNENAALAEKLKAAEQRADELAAKAGSLEDENAKLDLSIHELTSANRRLTAEAERLDKKLADVSVAVTANDKKLSDAAERLAALAERAERLCEDLAERSNEICRNFDTRIALLSIPGVAHSNSAVGTDGTDSTDDNTDTPDIAEDTDEYLELDRLTDIDELPAEGDPNLFEEDAKATQVGDAAPEDTDKKEDTIEARTDDRGNEPKVSADVDDGDVLNALRRAVAESIGGSDLDLDTAHEMQEPNVSDANDEDGFCTDLKSDPDSDSVSESDSEPAVSSNSSKTSETQPPSPTDDDIKSMLAAMYADSSSQSAADTPQSEAPVEADAAQDGNDSNKNSDFGSVKSTLEAIRRKIGNKNGENGK